MRERDYLTPEQFKWNKLSRKLERRRKMKCKHKYIGYNSDTKDYACLECRLWLSTGKAPKDYVCSDTPGVYKKK